MMNIAQNVPFWNPRRFNGSGGKKDSCAQETWHTIMHVIVNSTSFLLFVFTRAFCHTVCMKQTLTAKLKLKTTPEQFAALRTTQLAYRDALNFVSRYSFEHGKMRSNAGLQKKGTRSATRRLIAISGRERRLKANANHTISRRIVKKNPHALIGIEQLTHIRQRTKRHTHKHKKNGQGTERVSVKQRKSNRVYSQWSFAELHGMLAYKAVLNGSMVVRVDADYTSKGCPKCGHIEDANRPNKGLLFCCVNCHYTLHADLIGARNIVMRTLLVRQDWARTGQLSVAPGSSSEEPDVSIAEAKAARLRRYAELRWISDTSPWSLDPRSILTWVRKSVER